MSLLETAAAALRRHTRHRQQSAIAQEMIEQFSAGEITSLSEYLDRYLAQKFRIKREEGETDRHLIARALGLNESQFVEYYGRVTAGEDPRAALMAVLREN